MVDFLVILIVGLIVGIAAGYLYKAKKKGIKCIGCPDGAKCSGNCAGCSGSCGGNSAL